MEKIGVTTSSDYTDLDGLSCAVAYCELLSLEGKSAEIIIPGKLNASVTEEIKGWVPKFLTKPSPETKSFVSVDNSYIKIIPDFAVDNLIEIYDHREWDKEFWMQRLGDKAKIEFLGAAATLIWEEFNKRGFKDKITQNSARLLYAAICSNTLNFTSKFTDKRDIEAFKDLSVVSNLPKGWVEKYFEDQEVQILQNPAESIINDTKKPHFYENLGKEITVGQLELWNSEKFVEENIPLIVDTMEKFGSKFWFFNAPSISQGKSFVVTNNDYIKKLLTNEFGIQFKGDVGQSDRIIERKEYYDKLLNL